jgi:hypothetical protein
LCNGDLSGVCKVDDACSWRILEQPSIIPLIHLILSSQKQDSSLLIMKDIMLCRSNNKGTGSRHIIIWQVGYA